MSEKEHSESYPSQEEPSWPEENFGDALFKEQIVVLKERYDLEMKQLLEDASYVLGDTVFPTKIDGTPNSKPIILTIPARFKAIDKASSYEKTLLGNELNKDLQDQRYRKTKELSLNTNKGILKAKESYLERGSHEISQEATYIRKSGETYKYDGKPLKFNHLSGYGKVFEAVFRLCPSGGFAPYEEIEEQLRAQGLEPLEGVERNGRITRGLNKWQGFLKYATVNGKELSELPPREKKLFEIKSGHGIQFSNKK